MRVKADTITRTVLLIVALINQILTITGHSIIPLDNEFIEQLIAMLFTTVTSLWSWWKNNSFTSKAIDADEYLQKLREGDSE